MLLALVAPGNNVRYGGGDERWGEVWWQEMRGEGGCSGGEKDVLVRRGKDVVVRE